MMLSVMIFEEKTTPKNRDEQEIVGDRDVLNVIHESFDAICKKMIEKAEVVG